MNTYIKKTHVVEQGFSEIDFDLYDEFGFKSEDDDQFIEIVEGHGRADGYPIKIDRMIEALTNLKKFGATHVELDYHCDHIGYDITGYAIQLATDAEIEAYENEKTKAREIQSKKLELLRQLRELDEKAHKQTDDIYPF